MEAPQGVATVDPLAGPLTLAPGAFQQHSASLATDPGLAQPLPPPPAPAAQFYVPQRPQTQSQPLPLQDGAAAAEQMALPARAKPSFRSAVKQVQKMQHAAQAFAPPVRVLTTPAAPAPVEEEGPDPELEAAMQQKDELIAFLEEEVARLEEPLAGDLAHRVEFLEHLLDGLHNESPMHPHAEHARAGQAAPEKSHPKEKPLPPPMGGVYMYDAHTQTMIPSTYVGHIGPPGPGPVQQPPGALVQHMPPPPPPAPPAQPAPPSMRGLAGFQRAARSVQQMQRVAHGWHHPASAMQLAVATGA